MASTVEVNNTVEFCSSFLNWADPTIGANDEPFVTGANIAAQTVTGPPFAWPWNRSTVAFQTTPGVQDYTVAVGDCGYLEAASLQLVSPSGSPIMPLEVKWSVLTDAVEQDRPSFICLLYDPQDVPVIAQSVSGHAVNTTTITLNLPEPVQPGDIPIGVFEFDFNTGSPTLVSVLDGRGNSYPGVSGSSPYTFNTVTYSGSFSFTFTFSSVVTNVYASLAIIRNASPTAVFALASASGSSVTTPSITTQQANSLTVSLAFGGGTGQISNATETIATSTLKSAIGYSPIPQSSTLVSTAWTMAGAANLEAVILGFSPIATPTFRLLPVPNAVYQVNLIYQKIFPLFSTATISSGAVWGMPDTVAPIYSYFMLFLTLDYFDDPRAPRYQQIANAALLSRASGLEETDRNLFLGNMLPLAAQETTKSLSTHQGTQARGI